MPPNILALFLVCACVAGSGCLDATEMDDADEEYLVASSGRADDLEGGATDLADEAEETYLGTPYCHVYTDSGPSGRLLVVTQDYEYLKAISSGSWVWNTWNDVISAVDCRNGAYLWVYEHSYFQGRCRRLAGYISTLHTAYYSSIGDRISSIGFMRKPASCPTW